jgi:glycosyl transferase family 25
MIYINLNILCEFGNLFNLICTVLAMCFKNNLNLNNIYLIDYKLNRKIPISIYDTFKKFSYIENSLILNDNIIHLIEPIPNNFNEMFINKNEDYIITGTFNSIKYFKSYIEQIKSFFDINYNIISENHNLKTNKILIYIKKFDGMPQLNPEYYFKALDEYLDLDLNKNINYDIYVYSNDKNININNFNFKNKVNLIVETNQEKLFYSMLDFDHYIISNSNLALLAYHFRKNKNATITMPPIWSYNLTSYDDLIGGPYLSTNRKLENTYIINLESRLDRKIYALEEVSKIAVNPTIFKAIYNKYGPYGSSLSHISLLKLAQKNNLDYICICEDDIVISYPEYILYSINEIIKKPWDVIIIGGKIIDEFPESELYSRIGECQTMTGYIVNKNYYEKILNNFTEGLNKFFKEKEDEKFAIDMYWKLLQKDLWFTPKYKYVAQSSGFSDTANILINYNVDNQNYFDCNTNFDYLYSKKLNDNILILYNLNLNKYMINFIKEYPYLILNNFCYKLPYDLHGYSFKYLIGLLNIHDIIQLQFNDIESTNIELISNAILINNKVIRYLSENCIKFNQMDFTKFKTYKLSTPIFLSSNNKFILDLYNSSKLNNKYIL